MHEVYVLSIKKINTILSFYLQTTVVNELKKNVFY